MRERIGPVGERQTEADNGSRAVAPQRNCGERNVWASGERNRVMGEGPGTLTRRAVKREVT
jgi:hypothetical protein